MKEFIIYFAIPVGIIIFILWFFFSSGLRRNRKHKGGRWYEVYEWDEDYDTHITYWTQDKPEEWSDFYGDRGLRIISYESYDDTGTIKGS